MSSGVTEMTRAHTVFCSLLAATTLALPGCDSGGGIVAGIDRGGVQGGSVGTISGFGSVIVNDVHYGTAGAAITVNGVPAAEADLEVGYVVVVHADIPADGSAPSATSIDFSHDIIGPVLSVDAARNELIVLDQRVLVDDATIFGPGIDPASVDGLAALPASQVVRVSGLPGFPGTLVATRIELGDAGAALEIEGVVSFVDSGGAILHIGSLVIDYSGANLDGFDGGRPSIGDRVEVEGDQVGPGGALIARELTRKELDLSLEDGVRLEVEGLIHSLLSPTSFNVSGIQVRTGAQTSYENGDASMLVPNTRVEVEGTVDANGFLLASEVEFKLSGEARIEALAEAIDATAGTLTALGITIRTDGSTVFEDKSSAELRPFGLRDIDPGNPLHIRGTEEAGALRATLVQRSDPLQELAIRGIATNVSDPQFSVLGVTVLTDGQTEIDADFFATAEGRLVHVAGDTATGSFVAYKVEIKD